MTQRLKSRKEAEAVRSSEPESPEIVEEVVETAGDYKKCECCGIKVKGMVKLLKHQQNAHFTCTMCPEDWKWIGLSIEHLNIHQKNTHKVRVTKQKCDKCKLTFPDAMAKNVHNLKEHKFMCTQCSEEFNDKKSLTSIKRVIFKKNSRRKI